MCLVDLPTGRLSLTETDFNVIDIQDINIDRHYRSINNWLGDLGYNWGFSLSFSLSDEEKGLVFRSSDGRRINLEFPSLSSPYINQNESVGIEFIKDKDIYWPTSEDEYSKGVFAVHSDTSKILYFNANQIGGKYLWVGMSDKNKNFSRVRTGANGKPSDIFTPSGKQLTFFWNENNLLGNIKLSQPNVDDSEVIIISYTYDENLNLISAQDRAGYRYYKYKNRKLTFHQDRTGKVCSSRYDSEGRCIKTMSSELSSLREYAYDITNNVTRVRNSEDYIYTYKYNKKGQVEKTIDPTGATSIYVYDFNGRLVEMIDQKGNKTELVYSVDGQLVSKNRADESFSCVVTNDKGDIESLVEETGVVTEYSWDDLNRVSAIKKSGRGTTKYGHAKTGEIETVKLPWGREVFLYWSSDRRTLIEKDSLGVISKQKLDLTGLVLSYTDDKGNTTDFEYDSRGYPKRIIHPDKSAREFKYDAEGRILELKDEIGNLSRWKYDKAGRRVLAELPNKQLIQSVFDPENRLTGIKDIDGSWHKFVYDSRGKLLEQHYFDKRNDKYSYDAKAQLSNAEDSSGDKAIIIRNEVDDIIQVIYPDSTRKNLQYFSGGILKRIEFAGHFIEREYNSDMQVLLEQQDKFKINYEYSDSGDITETWDNKGRNVLNEYDDLGHLIKLEINSEKFEDDEPKKNTDSRSYEFEYDRKGNVKVWKMPGGKVEQRQYSSRGWLVSQIITKGNDKEVILKREYKYNLVGKLIEIRDSRRGTKRYQYDEMDRLIRSESNNDEINFYTYNDLGDLSSDDIVYEDGHRIKKKRDILLKYDARGFITKRKVVNRIDEFSYNFSGLLSQVNLNNQTEIKYEYDGLSRLIRKEKGQDKTDFYWDKERLWGFENSDCAVEFNYLKGEISPFEQYQDGSAYTIHTDHIGTVQELIDIDGNIVWENLSSPWGERPIRKEKINCPLGFPGQFFDEDTHLFYNRYRFYYAEIAHYSTPDPIGIWGGLDMYSYAQDPINLFDPLGLKCRGKTDDSTLYRGDKRSPDVICSEGFQPQNPAANLSVYEHVEGVPKGGSNWISTTHNPETAKDFGGDTIYVIANPVIDDPGCHAKEADCDPDLIKKYGTDPASSEHEILFRTPIPPKNVVGYYSASQGPTSFQVC